MTRDRSLPFIALRVSNPTRATRYLVLWPAHPSPEAMSCDCADYAHRGLGTCKHIEAARLWAGEHPSEIATSGVDPAPPPDWTELDRRFERRSSAPRISARALRWAEPELLKTER
ncbi:MAG: hypothetical protein L3J72_02835 [Thermoplasmata archaeon]|nr:hypothetical protein [Thermoplasmata archaeon]